MMKLVNGMAEGTCQGSLVCCVPLSVYDRFKIHCNCQFNVWLESKGTWFFL
jgi:hypothetical protein